MKTMKMWKWCAGVALAAVLAGGSSALAQIVTFDFAGLAGNEATATNNAKDANLDDTVISRSPTMPSAASNGDRFNSTNWAIVSIANAVSGGKYMEFTITPKAGYQFNVSSIYVQWQRSSTGNRGVSLRSSLDSYASDIGSEWALNDVTTTQNNTWTFDQGNSATPVTYRLYSWAEAITGTGGPGDGTGNDIVVNGTVSSVGGASAPSVTTVAASAIDTTTATANGDVTDDGGDTVTERGVCYKTSSGVAITDNPTAAAAGGTGEFSVDLSSLDVNQIYYFKAYAINGIDTTLADNELNFTTLANVPAAPTVGNATYSTLDVAVNANGNPASTEFAIQRTNDNYYLQADGSFGASEDWQTAAEWDTTTATGLTPETEYGFQVKARNGASVETAFGAVASESTSAAPTGIWINPMSAGTPMGTYYLGDTMGEWYVNFEIGQTTWDYAQVGIGTSPAGTDYNWGVANWYEDGEGSNKRVRRDLSGVQFTSTANYYVICQAKATSGDDYTSKSGNGWGNSQIYPPADLSSAYFAVSALNDPSGQTAEADQSSQINLFWTNNAQDHAVMVVHKLATDSWTEPTQGQSYSASDTIGAGTVIYKGGAEVFYDTGLLADTTYDYKFYSVNNDYYSAGVTAQETTLPCEPDAPTGLDAVPDYVSFAASWNAADRATGYRLDVSTEEEFGTPIYATDLFISEYVEGASNEKYVEIFNGTGASVDLADYALMLYANGSATPTASNTLAGTLANGAVAVYRNSSATNLIGSTSSSVNYNGDDAVALLKKSTEAYVDIFGRIGEDPGTAWTSGSFSTLDKTLVRKATVTGGVTSNPGSGFPTLATEWDQYAISDESHLDAHDFNPGTTPSFVAGFENLAVAGTSQSVTGLTEGVTYYFRVRAEGEGGCPSVDSATASTTTLEHLRPQVTPAVANVREGGEGRFFVRLNQDPGQVVEVAVSHSSGDEDIAIVGTTTTLTFRSSDWSTWQAVTLTAPEDANAASESATFLVALAGADDVFAEAATLDDDIADNLASAAAGATLSAWRGYRLSHLIDGVHAVSTNYAFTTWTSVPPGTITLDLQATSVVSRVRILTWDWNYRNHQYTIESSLDGSSWSMLADAGTGEHRGWEDWDAADAQMRYLRFTGLTNSVNAGVCVPELEVYGERLQAPALEFSTDNVLVREAGEGRLFIHMTEAPEGNVTVNVSLNPGDADVALQGETTLVFKPTNYDTWQWVTLAAGSDANAINETASLQISTIGAADQFVDVEVLDVDIGENVALASGGATVSGVRGYRTADLIDGVHMLSTNYAFTTWTSVPPGTMTVDMQTAMTVSRVRILTWDWNYRDHRYVIESSVDGSSWSTLADASTGAHRGWEDWPVADESIRYLRFTGLTNSVNAGVCVPELEVYGERPLPELIQLSKTTVNVREDGEGRFFVRLASAPAANVVISVARVSGDESLVLADGSSLTFKPSNWSTWQKVTLTQANDENADGETASLEVSMPGVLPRTVSVVALDDDIGENLALASEGTTMSGRKAYFMGYVIDGTHTALNQYGYTIWTNEPPGTMTLDLQEATTVSRVRLLNWDWTCRFHRYVVEGSADGSSWTTLADASGADRQGWDDWAVADETVRYVRFTGLTNSANVAVCISELEVYGTRAVRRRSLASSGVAAIAASEPVAVVTSDGLDDETGWNAVDGDDATAWVGQKAGGGYVVVEYAPTLNLSALEIDVAEGSLAGIEYLYSLDAKEWQPLPEDMEKNPVALNFLWLVFPDDGTEAVPNVIEIRPNP